MKTNVYFYFLSSILSRFVLGQYEKNQTLYHAAILYNQEISSDFFFKLHYGTINCKIVHNISPCNHLDTLICALKWKNLEFVKNPQPSLDCFETKITRASCVRAALQRLNHTCSRTILKGYIIGGNPF